MSTYAFDDNDNRLSLTTPGGTTSGTYDAQDRQLSYGDYAYTYTNHGELATKTHTPSGDVTSYSYDVYGNTTSVTLPSGDVIAYIVDGHDRRVVRKVNGVVERQWLYRSQLQIVAELDAMGNVVSRFVYAHGRNVPDYMVKPSGPDAGTYRLIQDHLGSVRLVVDVSDGTIKQRIDYDEFGNTSLVTGSWGFQPFGFAGGLYDAETGLVRFGARDYDATTGRWTAKDPLGFGSGDQNLYQYASGDPTNSLDPTGQFTLAEVLGGAFAGGLAISAYLASRYLYCTIRLKRCENQVDEDLEIDEDLRDPDRGGECPDGDPEPWILDGRFRVSSGCNGMRATG